MLGPCIDFCYALIGLLSRRHSRVGSRNKALSQTILCSFRNTMKVVSMSVKVLRQRACHLHEASTRRYGCHIYLKGQSLFELLLLPSSQQIKPQTSVSLSLLRLLSHRYFHQNKLPSPSPTSINYCKDQYVRPVPSPLRPRSCSQESR